MRWRQVQAADEWDAVLVTLPTPHVLQAWAWGEFKARWGWSAQRWVLEDEANRALAAMQVLRRQSGPFSVLYVPKGPVAVDFAAYQQAIAYLQQMARQQRALWLKIDGDAHFAQLQAQPQSTQAPSLENIRLYLTKQGWHLSAAEVQFRNTGLSDINQSDEQMLAAMKQKWRYNVRLAEKRGVVVREGSAADDDLLYDLYAETGQRDGFLIRERAYYLDAWRSMPCTRLIAELNGQALGAIVMFSYGQRAWYFYGMSRSEGREHMPSYALQWAAMRHARDHGCTVYDWWGAPESPQDEQDSMAGVWRFKQGFGAQFAEGLGAWDYAPNPLLYRLYADVMPRVLDVMRRTRRPSSSAPTGI